MSFVISFSLSQSPRFVTINTTESESHMSWEIEEGRDAEDKTHIFNYSLL